MPVFNRLNDFGSQTDDRFVVISCRQYLLRLYICRGQGQSTLDQRREVVIHDFGHALQSGNLVGEEAVRVTALDWHNAVRGGQNGARELLEQPALVIPCFADVAFQMGIFLERGITVRRQHLRMGINVDACSFRLAQQFFQRI
ncbi:hypothetical protein D1872_236120 [compost metagenome]